MKPITAADIAEMPLEQRIQLVEAIWDSIAEIPEAVEIPAWHKQELEKRLATYHADPAEGSPWQVVKKRIPGYNYSALFDRAFDYSVISSGSEKS